MTKNVTYGETFQTVVGRAVEQIEYFESLDTHSNVKILWNRNDAIPWDRGWVLPLNVYGDGMLKFTKLTQADHGFYTFRDAKGLYVERYRLRIEGETRNC